MDSEKLLFFLLLFIGRQLQSSFSVTYFVAWRIFSVNCAGFVPVLEASCGIGGTIQMVEIRESSDTNTTCTRTSRQSIRCNSDQNSDILNNGNTAVIVLAACFGQEQRHYQMTATALAHRTLTCTGTPTPNIAVHSLNLVISVDSISDVISDFSCSSSTDIEEALPVCSRSSACSAAINSTCTTSIGAVEVTQNLPIPSVALELVSDIAPSIVPIDTPNPTPSLSSNAPAPACSPGTSAFQFDLLTDRFPQETSWELLRESDNRLLGGLEISLEPETDYSWHGCLPSTNCYRFTITDRSNDGLCCRFGNGAYSLYFNEELIHSGGTFGSFEATRFGGTCDSTPNPTLIPATPESTPNPTTPSPLAVPVGTPLPTTLGDSNPIADVFRVGYSISWLISNVDCDGYVPVLEISCGSGGAITFLRVIDFASGSNNNPSCSVSSIRTIRCTSDYDLSVPDTFVLSNSVSVICSGTDESQYQVVAQALAQPEVSCLGASNYASQSVAVSYANLLTGELERDSRCQSDTEVGGLCINEDSCIASVGFRCTISLDAVMTIQNIPLPPYAVEGGTTRPTSPTPLPTPHPTPLLSTDGPPQTCSPATSPFRLDLFTDRSPGETTWELRRDYDYGFVGSLSITLEPQTRYSWSGCLDSTTCYRFTIRDRAVDGLCCAFGMGEYSLYFNEVLVHSGGTFGLHEITRFGSTCASTDSLPPQGSPTTPPVNNGNDQPSPFQIPDTPNPVQTNSSAVGMGRWWTNGPVRVGGVMSLICLCIALI